MTKCLNLGCGDKRKKNALNIDLLPEYAEVVMDLNKFPWCWRDNSIDRIYMHHLLEHFQDMQRTIEECYRVLKPGGILDITVPHSSGCKAIGCMGHYRTFSYNTLDDYLCRDFYMFKRHLFECVSKRLVWTRAEIPLMKIVSIPIQWGIDLSPRLFERFWCYWVGGAEELQWVGRKVA